MWKKREANYTPEELVKKIESASHILKRMVALRSLVENRYY